VQKHPPIADAGDDREDHQRDAGERDEPPSKDMAGADSVAAAVTGVDARCATSAPATRQFSIS
jgi:hypothetical protein